MEKRKGLIRSRSARQVKGKKPQNQAPARRFFGDLAKPPAEFTRALAEEIVKRLTFGRFPQMVGRHEEQAAAGATPEKPLDLGDHPILIDTSILIDGRILPIVNSGFITGTLLVPQFVLGEVQHIADSSDSLRRAKGRRGLDVAGKLRWQRANPLVKTRIIAEDVPTIPEIDHKLVALVKRWQALPGGRSVRLATVDFNLAHLARAQGVMVLNVHDMAQALKLSLIPGEELTIKIAHEGKERAQGVGYLADGTMVVVEEARSKVGMDVVAVVVKVHQTPAGQLFFARLK